MHNAMLECLVQPSHSWPVATHGVRQPIPSSMLGTVSTCIDLRQSGSTADAPRRRRVEAAVTSCDHLCLCRAARDACSSLAQCLGKKFWWAVIPHCRGHLACGLLHADDAHTRFVELLCLPRVPVSHICLFLFVCGIGGAMPIS